MSTCDTSVLVPALLTWHPDHLRCREALRRDLTAHVGHVVLECFSVLTRLPAPHRLSAPDATRLVTGLGLPLLTLPGERLLPLLSALGPAGVRGGAVNDAVVAASARHHDQTLLSRDRRARATYDVVGVRYAMV